MIMICYGKRSVEQSGEEKVMLSPQNTSPLHAPLPMGWTVSLTYDLDGPRQCDLSFVAAPTQDEMNPCHHQFCSAGAFYL